MEKRQVSTVNMFSLLLLFFKKYEAVFKDFDDLVALITAFEANKVQLDKEIAKQTVNNIGIATGKSADFDELIKLLVKASRKARTPI